MNGRWGRNKKQVVCKSFSEGRVKRLLFKLLLGMRKWLGWKEKSLFIFLSSISQCQVVPLSIREEEREGWKERWKNDDDGMTREDDLEREELVTHLPQRIQLSLNFFFSSFPFSFFLPHLLFPLSMERIGRLSKIYSSVSLSYRTSSLLPGTSYRLSFISCSLQVAGKEKKTAFYRFQTRISSSLNLTNLEPDSLPHKYTQSLGTCSGRYFQPLLLLSLFPIENTVSQLYPSQLKDRKQKEE